MGQGGELLWLVVIGGFLGIVVLICIIVAIVETIPLSTLRVRQIEFVQDDVAIAYICGVRLPSGDYGLGIYSKDGKLLMVVSSVTSGPFAGSHTVTLYNQKMQAGVSLLVDSNGNGHVIIGNEEGKAAAAFGAGGEIPFRRSGDGYLSIYDKEGHIGALLTIDYKSKGGILFIYRTSPEMETSVAAVGIMVDRNGSGSIVTTDSLGLPVWTSPL